ncbi:conserved hypothetical protein [Alteribacillus persepolensis]|uniref:Purine nucleoside phosphorylase n=1 Tax=Alteribacillus persepolensis TaxID=568899 RepID=A0A1G7YI11_9BACI|nr:peptidoglycan editing factor PgeF [Alteribacillus persepolensis]SDG95510.1 conserved hypothetical protein [Alteribacillus persepolensis]
MEKDPFAKEHDSILSVQSEPFQQNPLLVSGMTTRNGGVGRHPYETLNTAFHVGEDIDTVIENRQRIARELNFPLSSWVALEQVHGSDIVKAASTDKGKGSVSRDTALSKADGFYTNDKGVLLVSFYADCVPLLFYAPKAGYIGLAHAGWKGTALNIGGKFVETWKKEEHIDAEDIYVVIGPSISEAAYEVDNKVITQMKAALPAQQQTPWYTKGNGKYQLNMKQMNRYLLESAGISPDHIFISSYCTYTNDAYFFSHRRDGQKTGRMMTFIGFRDKE